MEAATVQSAAAFLETGHTTIVAAVCIEHRRATRVGGSIEITATPPRDADGRRLTFIMQAIDGSGQVGRGGRDRSSDRRPGSVPRGCVRRRH
jgi:fluoroacetyl-CoA thioesterase